MRCGFKPKVVSESSFLSSRTAPVVREWYTLVGMLPAAPGASVSLAKELWRSSGLLHDSYTLSKIAFVARELLMAVAILLVKLQASVSSVTLKHLMKTKKIPRLI
jgi:hypothetical protein